MSCPLVVLRPEPGLGETLTAARSLGLNAIGAPLFAIETVAWEPADSSAFDGIILGSANAVRHAGPALACLVSLPVYAVGERTAAAAREAGFSIARVGVGGLQHLLDTLEGPLRLLRLAGEDRAPLEPPARVTIEDRVVYRARALDLAGSAASALMGGGVVLLHSGAAAKRFADECDRLAIDRASVSLAALAPAIAAAAGPGWCRVEFARTLTDAALLAMAADMCHNSLSTPPATIGTE